MSPYWKRFSILAFLGLVISGYLLFHYTEVSRGFQSGRSFCTINAAIDCDAVAKSSYSFFLGIPVAGWAILYYLLLLVLVAQLTKEGEDERRAANVLLFYSAMSLPPTVGLLAISHFVLGKYCLFCGALDIANLLLFLVALYCPSRRDSFVAAIANGAGEFFKLLLSPRGMGLWAVAVVGALSVYLVPEALVRHYFMPRHQKHNDAAYLEPILQEWRKAPPVVAPFNRAASPADRDFGVGSPSAPVTIIEFSDFECPFCKRTAEVLKPFVLSRPDDFQFIFKNYPLDQSCNRLIKKVKHEYACKAAVMARCAGAQSDEKFWKMHDALMALSDFDDEALQELIEQTGVHRGAFESCMNEPAALAKVKQDIELGASVKVAATPTLVINGKKALVTPDDLPGVLEQILKEVKR